MEVIFSIIAGYITGSFPTAYLLLKKTHGTDIRDTGSGNVGAMNYFSATGSKKYGFLVFCIDFIKGVSSILLVYFFIEKSFILCGISLTSSVLSHCYSPWINFKGGKGLATAAGGAILLSPLVLAGWCLFWGVFYSFLKNINKSNVYATLILWFFCVIFAEHFPVYLFSASPGKGEFIFPVSILFFIILSKHFTPLRSIIENKNFEE